MMSHPPRPNLPRQSLPSYPFNFILTGTVRACEHSVWLLAATLPVPPGFSTTANLDVNKSSRRPSLSISKLQMLSPQSCGFEKRSIFPGGCNYLCLPAPRPSSPRCLSPIPYTLCITFVRTLDFCTQQKLKSLLFSDSALKSKNARVGYSHHCPRGSK